MNIELTQSPLASASYGLAWAIKRSLVAYVQRTPDGQVWINTEGVNSANEFLFAFDERASGRDGEPPTAFRGEVGLTAHGGLLRLLIADPRIEAHGTLSVRTASDSDEMPANRIALARLEPEESEAAQPHTFRCVLTEEGAHLFGATYPAGTELAPVGVWLPASRPAVCA